MGGIGRAIVAFGAVWIAIVQAPPARATSGPTSGAAVAALRQIALQPSDLPAEYVQYLARSTRNRDIARENGVPLSVYRKMGRVVGYETAFRSVLKQTVERPLCCIDVQVVRYRTARGARQAFTLGQSMVKNTYGKWHGFNDLYDRAGDTGVQFFLCTCGTRKQAVYIITTHLSTYLISTELHFAPSTAAATIARTASSLQSIMVQRLP